MATGRFDPAKLKALKALDGRSWKEIAEAGGLSVSALMDMAGGHTDPTTKYLTAAARGLGVSPAALLDLDEGEEWRAGFHEGVVRSIEALQQVRREGLS